MRLAATSTRWRTVWIFAMFDLPMKEERERRAYTRFRKELLNDGFSMMQYSVYYRHCVSHENAQVHIQRMIASVPVTGEVRFIVITDKQFEKIVTYWGKERAPQEKTPDQLTFL